MKSHSLNASYSSICLKDKNKKSNINNKKTITQTQSTNTNSSKSNSNEKSFKNILDLKNILENNKEYSLLTSISA